MLNDDVFDVAIIGGGPAGLFAAKHLLENAQRKSVLLLDKGPRPDRRNCPADVDGCKECGSCNILSGLGGAGLHSDGKLILDLDSGGYIQEFAELTQADQLALVDTIKTTLERFDGKSERGPRLTADRARQIGETFERSGFALKAYDVLHMGTSNLAKITKNLVDHLESESQEFHSRFTLSAPTEVVEIKQVAGGFSISSRRGSWKCHKLIVAVGKSGAPGLRPQLEAMGIETIVRPVWIGVRVETSAESARDLLAISFDPKLSKHDHLGRVKTHCFCRGGGLLVMKYRGATLVGGHSVYTENNQECQTTERSGLVNFNVLASRVLSQDTIDGLLQMFAGAAGSTVAVQDMRSFLNKDAPLVMSNDTRHHEIRGESADIRAMLDEFQGIGSSVAGFLRDLDKLYPGLAAPDARVLAPAMEWDFGSLDVTRDMETGVRGLYAVGDGAGLSQGIVHAAATGIVAARAICAGFEDWNASDVRERRAPAVAVGAAEFEERGDTGVRVADVKPPTLAT